ncbi:MAG: lipo-like protein [Burkholderiaceae bacterium]
MPHIPRTIGQLLARYLSTPRLSAQTGMPAQRDKLLRCLRPGDVLLVEGSSRIATVIKYLTQSTWSHAAFFVGPQLGGVDKRGEPYLFVEADMVQGVCKRPLSHYQSFHTRICRACHLSDADRDRLLHAVMSKLGEQYDLKNVFDLARYLFPAPPVPGRWRRKMIALGSGDPTRAICSSLIAEVFQSVGYPILPMITIDRREDPKRHKAVTEEVYHIRDRSLYAPRDFDVSPYFEIVKPTLVAGFDYRHIHWE